MLKVENLAKKYNGKNGYTIENISLNGKGGEIVIADANGNGALEIEEVFMNKILTDVAGEFTPSDRTDYNLYAGGSDSNNTFLENIKGLEETAEEI